MTKLSLSGCTILVVEDEYLLADDLCSELADRDATVVGPAATVEQGVALLEESGDLNGAILDVNLRGEPVFPLADALMARNVPFVFTTGYDASAIPERFDHVSRCEKPVHIGRVVEAIGRATHS
jgi:DNA-binding NtrC family response regulator